MVGVSVLIALVGACCMALGSALQERDAIRAPGGSVARPGLLVYLLRSPRWLVGTGAAAAGVTLHLVALSGAPLTIIQPIGVTGLVFAIVLSALLNGRRVQPDQILAGVAVTVGLVGVLWLFPHTSIPPALSLPDALTLAGIVVVAGIGTYLLAPRVPAGPRGVLLATVGGAALGTTSAFARVVASAAATNPAAVISWLTVLAVGIACFGALLQQNAYRTGHFAAAYATLLVADPVIGAGIGVVLLGEEIPTTPAGQLVATAAAGCVIAGTAVLARTKNRNPEARDTERTIARPQEHKDDDNAAAAT